MGLRIAAGKLDTAITLERVTTGQDSYGAPTETWTAITGSPKFAQYMALRGTEAIETQKRTSNTVFKLRIRRLEGLTPTDRVKVGTITADITSIEDGQRQGDMVLWCEVKA
jgi:head-tail adaptor